MRSPLYLLIPLFVCLLVACKVDPPKPPVPVPDDGMNHDSLTVIEDLFCNPERGFHTSREVHTSDPQPITVSAVKDVYDKGFTLVHIDFYMEAYRDTLIADSYLDVVRTSLQSLREGGCKGIIRFAYTNSESQHPHEAPLDLMLQHIAQIKPILQEYADVIFVMEAGLVGVWGEWYYTTYFKQNPMKAEDFVDRRKVLDALLDALPKERMICVRTPEFKLKCYDLTLNDTITMAEAYNGSDKSRLAAHDDAFMANSSDLGTFTMKFHRTYWSAETRYVIYGGESCQPGSYANAENSLAQMEEFHISYLNNSYHRSVISGWQKEGRLDEMRRRIGYRLYVSDVATSKNPKAGEDLKIILTIENEGFASPKNPRDINVIIVNKADPEDATVIEPDSDPRFWGPETAHKVEISFKPENAGDYAIYLYMPDPKPTLKDDSRFAIRLANKDCWDETTGYNYISTVTVE